MPTKTPVKTPAVSSKGIIIERLNVLVQPLRDRHERHYKDNYFHLWADLLLAGILVGALVTLIWLLVWQPKPDFTLESRVNSSRILSGQSTEFNIRYANEEGHAIGAAVLELDVPKGFSLESAAPAVLFDENALAFNLGDLEAGDSGELTVRGVIRGELNERQFLGLTLSYQHDQIRKQVLNSLVYHIDA